MIKDGLNIDGVPIVRLENKYLQVDLAPSVGGRIVNILNKSLNYQFLWHNPNLKLKKNPPSSIYDSNFYGGIDDILPNDIPENINGVDCPDHGEVWTLEFDYKIRDENIVLYGYLPLVGLSFEKTLTLRDDSPYIDIDYKIKNMTSCSRVFLWRLHAALKIKAGDKIVCPANIARVADPQWSRCDLTGQFSWPDMKESGVDVIPEKDGSADFLFLDGLTDGAVGWERPSENLRFDCFFDKDVFPGVCYFASYGKLSGCYTAIVEPSTVKTVSIKEAVEAEQFSMLDAEQELKTRVVLYAGKK